MGSKEMSKRWMPYSTYCLPSTAHTSQIQIASKPHLCLRLYWAISRTLYFQHIVPDIHSFSSFISLKQQNILSPNLLGPAFTLPFSPAGRQCYDNPQQHIWQALWQEELMFHLMLFAQSSNLLVTIST